MSAHLTAPSPVLPLVLHLRSTLALAEATRAADRALMGRYVKPSLLRDMLVRLILAEFGEGRIRTISFYQRTLQPYGSPTSIRLAIFYLEDAKTVRLDTSEHDPRSYGVTPTGRLLTWAAEHIPRLVLAGGAE